MDQRRFISFFLVSMLIFFGWAMVQRTLFPPPPPEEVAVEGENPDGEADPNDPANEQDPPEDPDPDDPPADVDPEQNDPADVPPAPQAVAPQWFTLGSLKPGDPYELAITLNNRGAAVENIELATRNANGTYHYRDLEIDSGYLGYLALSPVDGGGCTVESIVPGSPADVAGLQVGDTLLSLGADPINSAADLRRWLSPHEPDDEVTLNVSRGGQAVPVKVVLTRRPLSIIAPESQVKDDGSLLEHQLSFLLNLRSLGSGTSVTGVPAAGGKVSLRDDHWAGKKVQEGDAQGVEFTLNVPIGDGDTAGNLEVVKTYWLRPRAAAVDDDEEGSGSQAHPGFDFGLEIEFRNTSPAATTLTYRLDGPTGLPKEGWWYANKIHPRHFMTALGARDIIWSAPSTGQDYLGCRALVKEAEDEDSTGMLTMFAPPEPTEFRFAGVDAQYFSVMAMPLADGDSKVLIDDAYAFTVTDVALAKDDKGRYKNSNVTFRLDSSAHTLPGGESLTQSFTVFAGPKDPVILANYDLDGTISYGWFGFVSKPLTKLLHGLYWITGSWSYGLAILLMTLIVRSCMLPLGLKAARSAKKMQELAPEIKKIKEKYPDDMEKQWRAQQELFKKNNASQFGGCLPMFLQLPIFLGLYRALAIDIELRQAPMIPGMDWCSNLAGPDKLFYWEPYLWESLGGEYGWLGPYFNILPVFTVVLFYLHQKLFTPPATDDQQKQVQQMMSFMMIFFCVMFFKVPAGLCVYFITSSLWGLGERLLLKKDKKKVDDIEKPMPAATEKKVAKAKADKAERQKQLAKKQKKR